jgi:hypothetical protein
MILYISLGGGDRNVVFKRSLARSLASQSLIHGIPITARHYDLIQTPTIAQHEHLSVESKYHFPPLLYT